MCSYLEALISSTFNEAYKNVGFIAQKLGNVLFNCVLYLVIISFRRVVYHRRSCLSCQRNRVFTFLPRLQLNLV